MTQDEKRIKLAEASGWTKVRESWTGQKKACIPNDFQRLPLPDYFNDLNAVHELEELVWIDLYRYDYNNNLDRVVRATPVKGCGSKVGPWFYEGTKARRATAAERCEAIGLTLGLWEARK